MATTRFGRISGRRRPISRGGKIAVAIVLAAVAGGLKFLDRHRSAPAETAERGAVSGPARVVDGDGLVIAAIRIRLRDIDAPELDQTCRVGGRDDACGRTARDRLAGLVEGRIVACDWSRLDRYGRALARCRVGATDLGARMVADGWAVAYGGDEAEEAEARAARRGIWAGDFERPEDHRRRERAEREGERANWWEVWR